MIDLNCLGRLSLTRQDQPLEGFARAPRRLAILLYLVDRAGNGSLHRADLLRLFWPDEPEPRGRRALRNALYELRKALDGELLAVASDGAIEVDSASVRYDVWRFEQLVDDGQDEPALAIYQGPFLQGYEPPRGTDVAYHHWLDGRRESLNRLAIRAVERLARRKLEAGDVNAALRWAQRQVELAPLSEGAHRKVMELLDRTGNRADALRVYRALSQRLRTELEVEPSPETVDLAEQIRERQSPGALWPVENPLGVFSRPPPSPPTSLIGRTEELADIRGLLGEENRRAVTITGAGGTGKTRVAIAACEEVEDLFPDGIAFVELAAVRDPEMVPRAIAMAMGITEAENRSFAEGLSTMIGDRKALLVLDNFEQVIAAAPRLADLLARSPNLSLLVTSRAPLRIAAETEYLLRPLRLPSPADATSDPARLATFPATQLFLDRVRRVRPDFRADAATAPTLTAICRRLDGLPLALEIAAARLRAMDPESLLERLDDALDFLAAGARDLPERQRTLRATLDWSYSLLEPSEQTLLGRLAVFAGGWTARAAEAVCGIFGDYHPPGPSLQRDLESLVEKGLVEHSLATRSYAFLETIREYAAERMRRSGEEEALRRAHAQHYRGRAREVDRGFRSPEQITAVQAADREADNVDAALTFLLDEAKDGSTEAADAGMTIVGHLWFYWHVRGRHLSTRRWASDFLERSAEQAESPGRAYALRAAGLASWTLGDFGRATEELENALAAASVAPELAPGILFVLGVSQLSNGQIVPAGETLNAAVERSRALGEPWEIGMSLALLGLMEAALGRADEAHECFTEALDIQLRNGDQEGAGLSFGGLGSLESAAGRHQEAIDLHRQALAAFGEVGDRPEEARILDGWGWSALALGRSAEAARCFLESLRAYEEVGSVRGIGLALVGLAAVETVAERHERAVQLFAAAEVFQEQEGMVNDYAEDNPGTLFRERSLVAVPAADRDLAIVRGHAMSVRDAVRFAAGWPGTSE